MHALLRRGDTKSMPMLEMLESRELFSVALPALHVLTRGPKGSAVELNPSADPAVLAGASIYAQVDQAFRAVVGTVSNLPSLLPGYSLQAIINWGDGTPTSQAKLLGQADGSVSVLGDHTYGAAGEDKIQVIVEAVPPPGSAAPVLIIGTIESLARVFLPNGGVTLNETAGAAFTANVGTFRSMLSSLNMVAIINWGDGTRSLGKILALPTAGPIAGGTFAVLGDHMYAAVGSYHVHVMVMSPQPSPVATITSTMALVAQFDSVIDVLPPSPAAI